MFVEQPVGVAVAAVAPPSKKHTDKVQSTNAAPNPAPAVVLGPAIAVSTQRKGKKSAPQLTPNASNNTSTGTSTKKTAGKAPAQDQQPVNWQQQQLLTAQTESQPQPQPQQRLSNKQGKNHQQLQQQYAMEQYERANEGKEQSFAGSAYMNAPSADSMPMPDF